MTLWKSFGASVRGPHHIAEGLPNQDAWAKFHHVWGDGIVVSDGVGSKPFSSFGSDAACLAVELAVLTCCPDGEIERNSLFSSIQANWLRLVAPLEPRDCAATCLFALRLDGVIHIGSETVDVCEYRGQWHAYRVAGGMLGKHDVLERRFLMVKAEGCI